MRYLGFDAATLKVLIQRNIAPYEGQWALPGGFVHVGESVEAAAERELAEETGLEDIFLEQLYTFGDPTRDPREHVVTVSYFAFVNLIDHPPKAATDARNAHTVICTDALPPLAFDHQNILATAHARLRNKLRYEPVGFSFYQNASP